MSPSTIFEILKLEGAHSSVSFVEVLMDLTFYEHKVRGQVV